MGVRISWLMVARKAALVLADCSASSRRSAFCMVSLNTFSAWAI
ncbi:hypothetical protein [Zobellella sp. DQSA1]